LDALREGVDRYRGDQAWAQLRDRAMRARFTWDEAAERYERLYRPVAAAKAPARTDRWEEYLR
jgi:glycogen synthase